MKVSIIYTDKNGVETIEINGHEIQFGGSGGDGFCYTHNSFDCLDNLSKEELQAIQKSK